MGSFKVRTVSNIGLIGCEVYVEVDESKGLPKIEIIGLPDTAVKESKERIRSSFKNSGLPLPPRRIVVNLAPSHVKKSGTRFDLPIATAMLQHILGLDQNQFEEMCMFGELGLDGEVKRVTGLLPSVVAAMKEGISKFVVPQDNVNEILPIDGIEIYAIQHFLELVEYVQGKHTLTPQLGGEKVALPITNSIGVQLSDIKGHSIPKRALCIAAAGMHNILFVGPPGSGKSYLAKAIPSLLAPLHFDQVLEISQIYSVAGLLDKNQPLIYKRPFRPVHHTASKVSIVGGGQQLTPGEVSLAHLGVLFFDELAEFPSQVLEVLRQPLEDKKVTISRVQGSVVYPADIMFVAAMNPCKCGFYKDREKQCICSHHDILRYQQKISGPLLDRFDMIVEVPRENIDTIISTNSDTDFDQQLIVAMQQGREYQNTRYEKIHIDRNSQVDGKLFSEFIQLTDEAGVFVREYAERMILSARVVHKLCKVARTIADMEGTELVEKRHIAEATYYRGKTMFVGD